VSSTRFLNLNTTNLDSTDLIYSIILSTSNSFERTSGATTRYVAQLSCGPFLGQYANAIRLISFVKSSFSSESITGTGGNPISALQFDANDLEEDLADQVADDEEELSHIVFGNGFEGGITDIEFLNSTALGPKYAYNLFVGEINNGNQ
jgi:hypothetical protein